MKTDPDLPSDIGPYKKGDVKAEPPSPWFNGRRIFWRVIVAVVFLLFWLMVLSPIFGLLIGFTVETFMTFYNLARDAT